MKISVLVCTHNERDYVYRLLDKLTNFISHDVSGTSWEIVVIDDMSVDEKTRFILDEQFKNQITLYSHSLNNHYADHKNFGNSKCSGEWILNLDADEWVSDEFLEQVPLIIGNNPSVDAYAVPRLNTVDGLTLSHVNKWNWVISKLDDHRTIKELDTAGDEYKLLDQYKFVIQNESGIVTFYTPIVMWPDYQHRLYRCTTDITWRYAVHEQLTGYNQYAILPQIRQFAIIHHKEIARQEKQNEFYETLQRS